MASFVYLSFEDDVHRGNIDCDTDTFYGMLLTSAYTPAQTTHDRRDDLTNEASGTNYTAGGAASTVTVTKDIGNKRIDVALGQITWANASVTARYCAYYKRRGGAASADELVGLNDFGTDVSSTAANFVVNASTVRIQYP